MLLDDDSGGTRRLPRTRSSPGKSTRPPPVRRPSPPLAALILILALSTGGFGEDSARTVASAFSPPLPATATATRRRHPLLRPTHRTTASTALSGSDDESDEEKRPRNDKDIFGRQVDEGGNVKKEERKFSFFNGDDDSDIQGGDRIKSCVPYILPLVDGDQFGSFLYERVPPLGALDYVLLRPLVEAFHSNPFLDIGLFVTFALGPQIAGAQNISRPVRFNAQLAVLLDVMLIVPLLVSDAAEDAGGAPRALAEPAANLVYYVLVTAVGYCVSSCLRGRKPNGIPFLSALSENAIGPF